MAWTVAQSCSTIITKRESTRHYYKTKQALGRIHVVSTLRKKRTGQESHCVNTVDESTVQKSHCVNAVDEGTVWKSNCVNAVEEGTGWKSHCVNTDKDQATGQKTYCVNTIDDTQDDNNQERALSLTLSLTLSHSLSHSLTLSSVVLTRWVVHTRQHNAKLPRVARSVAAYLPPYLSQATWSRCSCTTRFYVWFYESVVYEIDRFASHLAISTSSLWPHEEAEEPCVRCHRTLSQRDH